MHTSENTLNEERWNRLVEGIRRVAGGTATALPAVLSTSITSLDILHRNDLTFSALHHKASRKPCDIKRIQQFTQELFIGKQKVDAKLRNME